MATILLAWNPKRFPWGSLHDEMRAVRQKGEASLTWSVGQTRKPQPQDRAFLVRLGEKPKGIVAAGWIVSSPFEAEHWDLVRARAGDTCRYVKLLIEYLSATPVVPWSLLTAPPLNTFNWSTQMSGISIPSDIAAGLEREWALRVPEVGRQSTDSATSFLEGRCVEVRLTRAERSSEARAACIAHCGLKCVCCEMTFAQRYGNDAAHLIVVHHLNPLGNSRGSRAVDPVTDLCPVCPNCHAVLHTRNPPLSVDEVRAMLRRSGRAD